MRQLKEKLTKYMTEHPIDFGTSDAETILDFLYGAYVEAHESEPLEAKALFAQLGEYLEQLPLETNNAIFFIIVKLCTRYQSLLAKTILCQKDKCCKQLQRLRQFFGCYTSNSISIKPGNSNRFPGLVFFAGNNLMGTGLCNW